MEGDHIYIIFNEIFSSLQIIHCDDNYKQHFVIILLNVRRDMVDFCCRLSITNVAHKYCYYSI